uniref:ATP synthase peripheral stalk subunit F6, mitochondrial n=1 Tax=Oreochromis niloticus TaxID=8128 RepID=A0A669BJ74_ORENI
MKMIIYPTEYKLLTVFSLLTEKAKAQPAEEVDKVLDKLFSERRPGTAPPAVGEVVTASVDNVAAESDDHPAPPLPLKEELLVQEEEGATGDKEDTGTHTDLDPVQRLFLEKIREYTNLHRLNAGFLEAEPDYQKNLSEETAKLQRVYGGGDLSSFPQFTFTDPKLDQESK